MKKFFKALGISLIYFLIYLAIQLIVSFVVAFAVVLWNMMQNDMSMENLESKVLEQTTLILVIANLLSIIAFVIIVLVRKKSISDELGIKKIKPKKIIPIILLGISLCIFISYSFSFIPFPESWTSSYAENVGVLSEGNFVVSLIATIILAPIAEEIVFRGLIYRNLKKGMPILVAGFISSLIFGISHTGIIWMIYAFLIGIFFVWIYEKFNSILGSIIVHMVFNLLGTFIDEFNWIPEQVGLFILGMSVLVLAGSILWIVKISKKEKYRITVIEC